MSWRNRRQDTYINHGKVTVTIVKPSPDSDYYNVLQTQKEMGSQGATTFEGVFPRAQAEETFAQLVADSHVENVSPSDPGMVGYKFQDENLDEEVSV